MKIALVALSIVALCGATTACSSEDSAEATTVSSTPAPTTTVKLTGDDLFVQELRLGGIYPQPSQVPLLTPAANGNCDALASTTLPDSQKFDKMVELSMIIGKGKNIFENVSTAETFMTASIRAYCPRFENLIPA